MLRVLLHLIEYVALEDVTKESVMGLLQAIKVIHKYIVVGLQQLHFAKSQSWVQAIIDVVETENVLVDAFDIQVFYKVRQLILADCHRGG